MDSLKRIQSIDILRGIVMIVMAIDHTREFWSASPITPEDVSQASIGMILTRLITHLCAPTFIFLSGISIYLRSNKTAGIRHYLFKRGLWLIMIELLIMGPVVTHGYDLIIFGILWVIGASMIALSTLTTLPRLALLIISLLLIVGHHVLPTVGTETFTERLLGLIYHAPFIITGKVNILISYTLIPWCGVMLLGFYVGKWFEFQQPVRRTYLSTFGGALLFIFVLLRYSNLYGDPFPWAYQDRGWAHTCLAFINVTKYPASFLFLCLILGIVMIVLAALEMATGSWTKPLLVFGKVPLFFFIMHFVLISGSSVLWAYATFGQYVNFAISTPSDWPPDYQPSLGRLYIVWAILIGVCYFPAQWFEKYRRRTDNPLLSYL